MSLLVDRERIEQIQQRILEGRHIADADIQFLLNLLVSQGERRPHEHEEKEEKDLARGQTTGNPQSSRTASKAEG